LFSSKIKNYAPEIIIFGAIIFLQFYRVGLGEIQSHDEGRYILRAEACLRFGAWLDQTQYAIGGLFSSSHPPLIVWMMALMRFLFGTSSYVSRIISPIAAVVSLVFFYKLAGRFFSRNTSLFGMAALGAAQHFLLYSHKGQFDIPMFAFVVTSSYYAIRAFQEEKSGLAILAGALFGCVLMSKAIQGLYLFPFICSLIYIYPTKKRWKLLVTILLTFALVALPWYIFMYLKYEHFYGENAGLIASLKDNSYAGGSTKNQWWYYINQTLVNFPLLIIGFTVIPSVFKLLKERTSPYSRLFVISFIWFLGMLIFLSDFYTRMLHFSLYLLLPTTLVICFVLEEFVKKGKTSEKIYAVLFLTLTFAWSLSELIRMSIKKHVLFPLVFNSPLLIASILIALIMFIFLYKYFSKENSSIILLGAVIFLITTDFYRWASRKEETYTDGARAVGDVIKHSAEIRSITVYCQNVPYYYMVPQLNYYTDCVFIGWDSTRKGYTNTWSSLDSLSQRKDSSQTDASILYIGWDDFYKPTIEDNALIGRLTRILENTYSEVLHTKKYHLYWHRRHQDLLSISRGLSLR
jgi:4-amino-4-deoxy-L-arabinose transferase-like glycosyltransferase